MKKALIILLVALIAAVSLTACGSGQAGDASPKDQISVVTTIFPEYDWVKSIVGDDNPDVKIDMLLENGVDLHSYQPSADDIVKISECDLFIYVGGESDAWVDDVLSAAENPDMVVINLMEELGSRVKIEEAKEGMQGEEEEEGPEYDEHVWLSLKNAAFLCDVIAQKLASIDPDSAAAYTDNAKIYVGEINARDEDFTAFVENGAKFDTLVFADRFPFRYFVDDYGLDYYSAFVGCSAETEASFETIVFLAGKADELGLDTIIKIESSDGTIADTVKNTTKSKDQTILSVDSLQSTTSADEESGANYLTIMKGNIDAFKDALD